MTDHSGYRECLQFEMEAALEDVLSILRHGVSGAAASRSADFICTGFFTIPKDARSRAILDPRVVASLEGIQRLILAYGDAALSRPEWVELSNVVLRLEFFCLISLNKTGCANVHGGTDSWISIPGTSLYVMPTNAGGELTIDRGSVVGSEVLDVGLISDERHADLPLIALPEAALTPPIANKRVRSLSRTQREEWASVLADAFDLLRLHGPSLALVQSYGWLLVPLEDEKDGYSSSISFNSLPNAIFTSFQTDLMFAETLVHEADHQWLYCVARFEDIWVSPDHFQEPVYRSPWRDDPRPLNGLLWGASAFVRVGSMWAALSKALPQEHIGLDWVRKRAVLCNYQAVDSLCIVQRQGTLSAFGNELLLSLIVQAIGTRDQLRELDDFWSSLQWAEATQSEHDSVWFAQNSVLAASSPPLCAEDYLKYGMPN